MQVKDSPKGKAACTKFTRISSNGIYSIVLCEPVTGRTHQVRTCRLKWPILSFLITQKPSYLQNCFSFVTFSSQMKMVDPFVLFVVSFFLCFYIFWVSLHYLLQYVIMLSFCLYTDEYMICSSHYDL